MNGHEPGAKAVGKLVEKVCIGDAIYGGEDGQREEERICYVTEPRDPTLSVD